MPTNQNAYNTRLTDEALEKRFRDTFRSQGGSELVDDLYASGVIIPVVDFTQAAEGSQLPSYLQQAWDFSTGHIRIAAVTPTNIITNAGFWLVQYNWVGAVSHAPGTGGSAAIKITDGLGSKTIWQTNIRINAATEYESQTDDQFIVFLRSGDSLTGQVRTTDDSLNVVYRQIATLNGDLVNPTGFTSS